MCKMPFRHPTVDVRLAATYTNLVLTRCGQAGNVCVGIMDREMAFQGRSLSGITERGSREEEAENLVLGQSNTQRSTEGQHGPQPRTQVANGLQLQTQT